MQIGQLTKYLRKQRIKLMMHSYLLGDFKA